MNPGHIDNLGWVIFAIVMAPLLFIVASAVFGTPRKPKVTLVFLATLAAVGLSVVAGLWGGGWLFSAVMG